MTLRTSTVRRALLLAPLLLALGAWPARAATTSVNSDATLRSAITSVSGGDTILFTGSITVAGDLPAVQTNLTIDGGP